MTLFEKIISGEIPSYKLYEDDKFFAFLDINPQSKGHSLVVPKDPYENLSAVPDELLGRFLKIAKNLATKSQSALRADGYNLTMNNGAIAGQEVFHAHLHIIPRYEKPEETPILNSEYFLDIQKKLMLQ